MFQAQDPLAYLAHIMAFSQLSAAIALCLSCGPVSIAQGNVAARAVEGIARQPEARGSITTGMMIGMAMAETSGIYGLVIAIILLFANPLVSMFMKAAGLE